MPALQLGHAGLSIGLSAETGGAIQNLEVRLSSEKAVAKNCGGETVAATYFDPKSEISYDLLPTSAISAASASPGVSLVGFVNYVPSAGLLIAEEVTTTSPNDNYKKIAVKCVNHPLITS